MNTITTPIAPGLWLIDLNFLGNPRIIGAWLLYDGKEAALVETGPASGLETLIRGIAEAGVPLNALKHLIVTHIHLDHSGAVGQLMRQLPEATAYVHPRGAPHLIDPSRLLQSASRLYGSLLETLWGETLPVPSERVVVLQDQDSVEAAGRRLVAHNTPGHAIHHHAYFVPDTGELFAGDIAGVRMPGYAYVRPPTPPPELDIEAWQQSIATLRQLNLKTLYLTHFGAYQDMEFHLNDLESRLLNWGELVREKLDAAAEEAEVIESLYQQAQSEMEALGIEPAEYDVAASYQMVAMGYIRYWRRKREKG